MPQVMRAIVTMVLAMALLALSDVFIKLSTNRIPVGQVLVMMSLGGTLLFVCVARLSGAPLWDRRALHPMVLWRNLFEMVGALGLLLSLAAIPLPAFAAIMQSAPLVVTLGAALFLGETVGWRRWLAIAVGIVGMLLVIKPGTDAFTPATLYAVLGVTGLAARDLVTRLAPTDIHSLTLSTWGFASIIPVGLGLHLAIGDPVQVDAPAFGTVAVAVIVTTTGYYAVTTAMRMAPASIVSPFRYSRLVFTMGLGIAVFGERPDGWTLTGAAIILCAGLYAFLRERRLALQSAQPT